MTNPVALPLVRGQLTAQQLEIYHFLKGYITVRHCAPTLGELADAQRLHSTESARTHLEKIAKKGWITFDASAERGVAIVEAQA